MNHLSQFLLSGHPSLQLADLWVAHLGSLSNPTACLRPPMKSGRVIHIRDAILSAIKRFAFEVPTMDNKFLRIVLTSKCQVSESQKNWSSSWVELCSDVAPFGSAAFTLLLWEGRRPQSSICFPLWNQSNDPICHFWETAAAPARGSRKRWQKNIICNSRILPERRKSSSL